MVAGCGSAIPGTTSKIELRISTRTKRIFLLHLYISDPIGPYSILLNMILEKDDKPKTTDTTQTTILVVRIGIGLYLAKHQVQSTNVPCLYEIKPLSTIERSFCHGSPPPLNPFRSLA